MADTTGDRHVSPTTTEDNGCVSNLEVIKDNHKPLIKYSPKELEELLLKSNKLLYIECTLLRKQLLWNGKVMKELSEAQLINNQLKKYVYHLNKRLTKQRGTI